MLGCNWVQNFPKNDDGKHQKSTKPEEESEQVRTSREGMMEVREAGR